MSSSRMSRSSYKLSTSAQLRSVNGDRGVVPPGCLGNAATTDD